MALYSLLRELSWTMFHPDVFSIGCFFVLKNASLTWPPDSRLPFRQVHCEHLQCSLSFYVRYITIYITISSSDCIFSHLFALTQVPSSLQAMFKHLILLIHILSSFAFFCGLFCCPLQNIWVFKWFFPTLGLGCLGSLPFSKACSLDPSGGEVRILGRGLRDFAKATEVFARDLVTWYWARLKLLAGRPENGSIWGLFKKIPSRRDTCDNSESCSSSYLWLIEYIYLHIIIYIYTHLWLYICNIFLQCLNDSWMTILWKHKVVCWQLQKVIPGQKLGWFIVV